MSMHKRLIAWLMTVGLLALPVGQALADFEEDYEAKKWEEIEVQLPAPPRQENLVPFYVSAAADNRFFVDLISISVGSDGVVRYTLVVVSPSGVRNVSFEGMRCDTWERRLYAFGRADGAWSKSRNNRWERVREATNNRHHAALFQGYFCPDGIIVRSAEQATGLLRRGGYSPVSGG